MNHIRCLVVYLILITLLAGCGKRPQQRAAEPLLQQANLEVGARNFHRALNLVEEALAIERTPQARALHGNLLYILGHTERAAQEFLDLAEDPKIKPAMRADLLNNAASALYRANKTNEAIKLWQELTTDRSYITPEVAWLNLGLAHLDLAGKSLDSEHRYQQAARYFEQALKISPDYVDALFYAAYTYSLEANWQRAHQLLDKLLTESPDHQLGQQLMQEVSVHIKKTSARIHECREQSPASVAR